MAYLTDEISERATQRRLDEITTSGVRALDERAARSAQIDDGFRQAQAKMAEQVKEMDKLVADSHEKRDSDGDKDESPTGPNQWAKREAKPTVLSFFDDEHPGGAAPAPAAQPAPSAPAEPQAPPPQPAPPVPPVPAVPEVGRKVLSLGFEDEEEPAPPAPARPQSGPRHAAQRPAPPEDDDDLSDVNWMR